ncbi:MAG: ATP-binding protein [Pseudomonadota bacterium]|nr:ATP-binding protein [Pseudomonadota bacterium]
MSGKRTGGGSGAAYTSVKAAVQARAARLVEALGGESPHTLRVVEQACAGLAEELQGLYAQGETSGAGDFHALVQRSPDAWIVYRNHHVLYANPVAGTLLGYDVDALRGRSVLDLIDPVDHAEVLARVALLEAGSPVEARETRMLRSDGTVVVLEVVSLPVSFAGDAAILTVARDVSVRREDQARRLQANQALSVGTLAAGVAHEINNPLTYVIANLGYALRELRTIGTPAGADPARFQDLCEAISEAQEGADRVGLIVRDLRAFSRLDDARGDRVDVRKVLQTSVNLAATEIRARARLVQDIRGVPAVMGSEGRLGQVFLNLLVNAAQAIPEGEPHLHEVRVASYLDADDQVVVEVRDTGRGIAPGARPRIFDPFFTTKPAGVGTGLGLSICLRIVSGLGGDIVVESAPGEGSTFRVRLPVAPGEQTAATPTPNDEAPALTVLVVDDEPRVGATIERALRSDHVVEVAASAVEALAILRAGRRYDLLLIDVHMPGMSGMEFYGAVHALDPALASRTLFITGSAFSTETRAFLARVPNPCLEKPFDPARLRAAIRALATSGS